MFKVLKVKLNQFQYVAGMVYSANKSILFKQF